MYVFRKNGSSKESARFPNLDQMLKALSLADNFRSLKTLTWQRLLLLVLGSALFGLVLGYSGLDFYARQAAIFIAIFLAPFVAAIFRSRSSNGRAEVRTGMERVMPRIVKRLLSMGELETRLGSPLAQRLEESAASIRQAQVAMVEMRAFGPKLPATYKATIKETSEALQSTFKRALWCLREALLFKVSVTDQNLQAFSETEDRIKVLCQETRGLATLLQKPAPALDTDRVLERLRTLQQVERSILSGEEPDADSKP